MRPQTPDARRQERPRSRGPAAPAIPDLREQIGLLEEELAGLWCSVFPRKGLAAAPARVNGSPRLLGASELERVRDDLARRVAALRQDLAERTAAEERSRRLMEEMLLDPAAYPYVRVSHEDIGEPGCRHWHVLPRGGLLGRLMKWWRVRISSGCPLARPDLRPAPTAIR
jgi:hypothetical protein